MSTSWSSGAPYESVRDTHTHTRALDWLLLLCMKVRSVNLSYIVCLGI